MKNREYIFVFEGKFLESDSLIDIFGGVTKEEWEVIVKGTIGYYCLMIATDKVSESLDKKDLRLSRKLKRTILQMKNIDPALLSEFDLEEIIEARAEEMKKFEEANQKAFESMRNNGNLMKYHVKTSSL